jgi:hypothetical protein
MRRYPEGATERPEIAGGSATAVRIAIDPPCRPVVRGAYGRRIDVQPDPRQRVSDEAPMGKHDHPAGVKKHRAAQNPIHRIRQTSFWLPDMAEGCA